MKKLLYLFLLLPSLLTAHESVDKRDMMNDMGMNSSLHIFIWIIFAIFIALILFFILKPKKNASCCGSTASALDILKQRYAEGKITKEEFENLKNQ